MIEGILKMKTKNGNGKFAAVLIVLMLASFLLASCTKPAQQEDSQTGANDGSLKKFSSEKEIMEYLEKNTKNSAQKYGGGIFARGMDDRMVAESFSKTASIGSATPQSNAGASEYSTTNIQVKGVDEADFVKNDDKYIYAISGNKLFIVDAYPAENAKILSETKFEGTPREMFINKDRLVVFADGNEVIYKIPEYDIIPREKYVQKTDIFVYDVSDRAKPKLIKDYSSTGYYFQSRMIGDYVYFITENNAYYYDGGIIMPQIKESGKVVASPEVYYFDNPEINYNFNTVASFNVFGDESEISAETFMMGYSNTLYVSQNNIYIAYQKNMPYDYSRQGLFYDSIVPLLPESIKTEIINIKNDESINSQQRWEKISSLIEDMYNSMDEKSKADFADKVEKSVEEYQIKAEQERRKTIIHKIAIKNGEIEYKNKGEINGYLLNQFSLDEHNDNLRVATTTYVYAGRSTEYNNVYVLDKDMKISGKLEDIAPDEKIYSTRFIGERLYMVTFKRIDPLFVIDLSSPEKPKILGELKIPGFSDYLHPYDENRIIGIGKETSSNEWGGVSVKGVKLALFDVSDVSNPKQIDKYEIGGQGTDSEALHEHKAFLFDKSKGILVIPVTEVKERAYDQKYGYYKWDIWQGAYVFNIDEKGFELNGKISHEENEDETGYHYYYGSEKSVRRSLFMDDVIYTISGSKIKANELKEASKEITTVELTPEKEKDRVPIVY